ncbi:DUF4397 domain-containing protein [Paenibacillus turpanensis]|uniref:DUF4397 domain-containing protein n=1 Tax=Paenibacillus turpanensis TaxID=2689078 RepID=UPI00140A04DF|nr:DUF4397 domain-containing protein [Paenibacillus turpanensis]
MNIPEQVKKNAELASMFFVLAKYYEYKDPQTHYLYYTQHLKYAKLVAEYFEKAGMPREEEQEEGSRATVGAPVLPGIPVPGFPYGSYPAPGMYPGVGTYPPYQPYAPAPIHSAGQPNAYVRFIHAIPDAPAVDISIDGRRLLSNVSFTRASGFIKVPAGAYRLELFRAGTTNRLFEETLRLPAGGFVTAAAVGTASAPKLALYPEQPAPEAGMARVRFLHLSPNAPGVDVRIRGGRTIAAGSEFTDGSSYITVTPGAVTVDVVRAGTTQPVFDIPNLRLEAGQTYTIAAVGLAGGQPALQPLVLRDF